jgi:hypothetical protein
VPLAGCLSNASLLLYIRVGSKILTFGVGMWRWGAQLNGIRIQVKACLLLLVN